MLQQLPDGAFLLPADFDRIAAALDELKKTQNAHATIPVTINLHVHYDYPKHITLGGEVIAVKSAAEEASTVAKYEAAEAAKLAQSTNPAATSEPAATKPETPTP